MVAASSFSILATHKCIKRSRDNPSNYPFGIGRQAMATGTQSSFDIRKLLTRVDNFSDSDQLEKLRLLATAVLPYGKVGKDSTAIEIYTQLEKKYTRDHAIPIITRLLDRAGAKRDFVTQLQEIPAVESDEVPLLYFTELLVDIADELGNEEYLSKLKNRIPDSQLGVSRDRISTAVQLFQQLIFEQTITFSKEIESLNLLAEWLGDIGRRDIAIRVEKEKHEREASKSF